MSVFDIAVLVIIALSALLGWWRGFMYELFSLIGWVAAYIVARTFSDQALPYVPEAIGNEGVRSATAFAALFVVTLVVSGIVAWLLSKLAKFAGLGGVDGKFGAMFGVVRGVLVVLALVWLGGLTSLPEQAWWKNAWTSKPLQQAALYLRDYLPKQGG
jgi:membrane protein required for colicin V production